MAGKSSAEAVFEELFIHVLGRRPEPEEERGLLALADPAARDAGLYEDVFWSLLNSTEFLFNH
jgi:hypothetical protein